MLQLRSTSLFPMVMIVSLTTASTSASVINLSALRATPDSFGGSSMDIVTGKYYSRSGASGYNGSPANIRQYTNAGAYGSDTGVELSTLNGPLFGTYFAVNNGKFFGRTSYTDATVGRWDAATGALETTAIIPGMGGDIFQHTFNWLGASAANVMQDQTGMYVVGKQATGNLWQVSKIDQNLNIIETKTFAQTQLNNYGYGIMVHGSLFLGESYNSDFFKTRFDFATGTVSSVSHEMVGASGFKYWSNMFYDPNKDSFYAHSVHGTVYSASGLSDTLGVGPLSSVPEPASMAVWSILAVIGIVAGKARWRA